MVLLDFMRPLLDRRGGEPQAPALGQVDTAINAMLDAAMGEGEAAARGGARAKSKSAFDDKKVIAEMTEKIPRLVRASKDAKRGWLATANRNRAYYLGGANQWGRFEPTSGQWVLTARKKGTVRYSENWVRLVVRYMLAQFLEGDPAFRLRGRHVGVDEKAAYEAANKFIQGLWHTLHGSEIMEFALTDCVLTGHGVIRTEYRQHDQWLDGEPVGAVAWRAIHPDAFHMDFEEQDLRQLRWCAECVAMSVDAARDAWPKHAELFVSDGARRGGDEAPQIQNTFDSGGQSSNELGEHVEVVEYWEPPSARFRWGVRAQMCGPVLLALGPTGYRCGVPYTHLRDIVVSGQSWGDPVISDVVAMNNYANESMSKALEHMRFTVNHQRYITKGHGIDTGAVTSQPGKYIEINPGAVVTPITNPPLTNSVFDSLSLLMQRINSFGSISDVELGAGGGGVRGTGGIEILSRNSTKRMAPQRMRFKAANEDLLTKAWSMAREFYQPDRIVSLVGKDNVWGQEKWDTIIPIGQELDSVEIVPETELGNTPESRRAKLTALGALGVLQSLPPNEILRLFNIEHGQDEDMIDNSGQEAFARSNIERVLARQPPLPPAAFMNHEAQIETILRYINSSAGVERMMALSDGDPSLFAELTEQVQMLVQAHEGFIAPPPGGVSPGGAPAAGPLQEPAAMPAEQPMP